MNRADATFLACALLLSGCAAAPAEEPRAEVSAPAHPEPQASAATSTSAAAPPAATPSASAAAPPRQSPYADVVGRTAPPTDFKLDGAIGEWGKLEVPPEKKGASAKPANVAVALTTSGVTIAGKIKGGKEGVTIRFDFGAGELPRLGVPVRGGGVAELNCETTWDGQPMDEAEKAACGQMLDQDADFVASWQSQFRRVWHVGPAGIRFNGAELPGAKSAFVVDGDNASFEVQVPIDALPLANESPVSSVNLLVMPTRSWTDPKEGEWKYASFEPAVAFGKRSAIRSMALQTWNANILEGAPAVGYKLGDDASWVIAERTSTGLSHVQRTQPLFTSKAKHKGLEIGVLYAATERIVCLKGDELRGMEFMHGELVSSVARPPGMHLFVRDQYTDETGAQSASWTVFLVNDEGEVASQDLERAVYGWRTVKPFQGPGMTTFGWDGTALGFDEAGTPGVRVRYQYHRDPGWYEMSIKGLP
ncbi:MAG: hypothetical protein HOW73_38065 [Polyangiaceae bacterium]|nr:hypothetical protein [Polyangiaceae bacterium]